MIGSSAPYVLLLRLTAEADLGVGRQTIIVIHEYLIVELKTRVMEQWKF